MGSSVFDPTNFVIFPAYILGNLFQFSIPTNDMDFVKFPQNISKKIIFYLE
jgi:hypothetical protein